MLFGSYLDYFFSYEAIMEMLLLGLIVVLLVAICLYLFYQQWRLRFCIIHAGLARRFVQDPNRVAIRRALQRALADSLRDHSDRLQPPLPALQAREHRRFPWEGPEPEDEAMDQFLLRNDPFLARHQDPDPPIIIRATAHRRHIVQPHQINARDLTEHPPAYRPPPPVEHAPLNPPWQQPRQEVDYECPLHGRDVDRRNGPLDCFCRRCQYEEFAYDHKLGKYAPGADDGAGAGGGEPAKQKDDRPDEEDAPDGGGAAAVP